MRQLGILSNKDASHFDGFDVFFYKIRMQKDIMLKSQGHYKNVELRENKKLT